MHVPYSLHHKWVSLQCVSEGKLFFVTIFVRLAPLPCPSLVLGQPCMGLEDHKTAILQAISCDFI